MSKLSKILLVIIAILLIALGVMTYLYFKAASLRDILIPANEKAVTQLYNVMLAIENAGLELEKQEDDTLILVERKAPVERVPANE